MSSISAGRWKFTPDQPGGPDNMAPANLTREYLVVKPDINFLTLKETGGAGAVQTNRPAWNSKRCGSGVWMSIVAAPRKPSYQRVITNVKLEKIFTIDRKRIFGPERLGLRPYLRHATCALKLCFGPNL
jgi:hypothetical protein